MAKEKGFEKDGIATVAYGNGMFKVKIGEEHEIRATVSGKMRQRNQKVIQGDRVKVVISPYDLEKGRIIYRYRS